MNDIVAACPAGRTGVAVARTRRRAYVDGTPHRVFNAHFLGALQLSADGAHLTYVVDRAAGAGSDQTFVVTDGIPGKGYGAVFHPIRLDADGRGVSYTARSGRQFFVVRQPFVPGGTR